MYGIGLVNSHRSSTFQVFYTRKSRRFKAQRPKFQSKAVKGQPKRTRFVPPKRAIGGRVKGSSVILVALTGRLVISLLKRPDVQRNWATRLGWPCWIVSDEVKSNPCGKT